MTSEYSCGACGNNTLDKKIKVKSSIGGEDGTIGVCSYCGSTRVVDSVDYDALYQTRESTNYPVERSGLLICLKQLYFKQEISALRPYIKNSTQRVLDYGCGGGEYANVLTRESLCQLYACDVQLERPSTLSRDVDYISINDIANHGVFDLIIMRHVLEHVEDAYSGLVKLSSSLNRHGKIFIEVPNANSFFCKLLGRLWPGYFYPYHVHVFTEKGLILLAKRANLSLISVRKKQTPIFGVYFMHLGMHRTLARVLSILCYPIQCLIGWVTQRHEALEIVLEKSNH